MATKITLLKKDELKPGQGRMAEVEGKAVAVFNVDGSYYAIDGDCTHQGGPLGEGDLQGTTVTCPWHGAEFDVTSGEVLNPPASMPVSSYKVVVEDGEVKIEV